MSSRAAGSAVVLLALTLARPAAGLQQFTFTFPDACSKTVDPFGFQLGSVFVQRTEYISSWCDRIAGIEDCSKHYWRGPKGSGKTVFLWLLGRELQKRDLQVYYIEDADFLKNITKADINFTIEMNNINNKRTVLMIDEGQSNSNDGIYTHLIRGTPSLIVLSVGVSSYGSSPGYPDEFKYNSANIFLQENELDAFTELWYTEATKRQLIDYSKQQLLNCFQWLLLFTGGLMYPMLAISDHLLSSDIYVAHFHNYQHYLTSFMFFTSKTCTTIKSRCFDGHASPLFQKLLNQGEYDIDNLAQLEKFGYWDSGKSNDCLKGWFVSDFLLFIVYNRHISYCVSLSREICMDDKIQAIIIMGLKGMSESDFMEGSSSTVTKMENAIGFCWGYKVRNAFPALFIAPQTRANTNSFGKTKPTVDFTFNGEMDVAIELSKNNYDIPGKLAKFAEEGVYHQWGNRYAILNFQLVSSNVKLSNDHHVYHFVKDKNILYRGNDIICAGVVTSLPTPVYADQAIICPISEVAVQNAINISELYSSRSQKTMLSSSSAIGVSKFQKYEL